jgi:hypothetical protein
MLKEDSPWLRKFDELEKDPGIAEWRAELGESKGVSFFGLEPSSIEVAPALTRWLRKEQQGVADVSQSQPPVLVDVGVERNDEPPAHAGVKMLAMRYAVSTQDGEISIEPDCDYLDAVRKGQSTWAFKYRPDPFPVCVPGLKVRILNNSSGQIVLNQVALAVERSSPTVEPFLVVVDHERPSRSILVVNEGAGETGPCTIRYGWLPFEKTDTPDLSDFPHELTTDGFERSWLADLSDGLAAEGLDLQALDALKSAGGFISAQGSWTRLQSGELIPSQEHNDRVRQLCEEFHEGQEFVVGCLECCGASVRTERIFFGSPLKLLGDNYNLPASPKSQEWDLTLSAEGEKYEVVHLADDIVKSGESVELKMSVGAMRPSRHRLSVQVRYNRDRVASSHPLSLRIFVPRSSYDDATQEWLFRWPYPS